MSLIFDGHDFSTLFVYGDPQITILNAKPDTREVSGRNGAAFVGLTYDVSTVAFTIAAVGDAETRRVALSTLGKWLMVDEPKPLYLPDTPDRYYLAVPSAGLELVRGIGGEMAQLTFTLVDPVAYGITERTAVVPYGGSVTFNVGGTAPTYPYFNRTLVRPNQTTGQWGWRLDAGDVFILDFGTTTNRYVQADFGERVAYVNDSLKLPTLNSDWFELKPGEHTIENHIGGGNDVTLRWHERWY